MGKKIDRGEPKKECPSCGLGVSLEANICEFCGWDFEEEDEWILQIEKLERDLLLEKQKFEPGTVNHKIETTLRSPLLERAEAEKTSSREAEKEEEPEISYTAEQFFERETASPPRRQEPPAQRPAPAPAAAHRPAQEQPKVRRVRSVKAPPAQEPSPVPPARKPEPAAPAPAVRRVKQPPARPPEPVPEEKPERKVRTVRKVKG